MKDIVDFLKSRTGSYQPEFSDSNDAIAAFTHYLQNSNNTLVKEVFEQEARDIYALMIRYKKETDLFFEDESVVKQIIKEIRSVPFPPPVNCRFSFIDLFAGVGGFRIAMQNIGGKCVYSSEWNKDAQRTYWTNYGEIPFGDITKDSVKSFIPEKFDILCAGFPCQAFSIAGYQKGFSDTRGTLFFDVEDIAKKHRPKVIFLENVKNLVSHDKGRTFKVILDVLENKLKYKVFYKVMNTMKYANIPQNRERIFVIAFDPFQVRNCEKFEFPEEIPLTKNIHDFIDNGRQGDKYYYKTDHIYYEQLSSKILRKDTVYQWRRIYVRENKNNVCPTLTANMGTGGHNVPLIKDDYGIRKLTPKECFAFQGYPMDRFVLPDIANSKLYMQAGNSVTTTLIERIANQIIKVLLL